MCVFFFKQKTAYDMRISDWSSDVCSSDLHVLGVGFGVVLTGRGPPLHDLANGVDPRSVTRPALVVVGDQHAHYGSDAVFRRDEAAEPRVAIARVQTLPRRSEEHTYELQSLMRISYAVFCLKKKKQSQIHARR